MADQIVLIKWDDGHNAPGPWYIAKIVAWNKHDEPHEFKDIGGLGVDGGIHRFDSTLLYFWRYCNDTEILYIQEVQKPFNIHVKRLQIINNKSVKMYDYFNPNEEFTMCYNTFDIVSIFASKKSDSRFEVYMCDYRHLLSSFEYKTPNSVHLGWQYFALAKTQIFIFFNYTII